MNGDNLKKELLEKVKLHLSIKDLIQDEMILNIIDGVFDHYVFLYNQSPSYSHLFILESITVRRYNRRNAEGITRQSVEGFSATYTDETKDFEAYDDKIKQDLGLPQSNGGVQFL